MPPNHPIEAVIFDLDGTLLDTEALSDRAMLSLYDKWLTDTVRQERQEEGFRLPWELKKQILGLRGAEWAPIVINYAEQHWNVPKTTFTPAQLWSGWETQLSALCHEVEACPGALALVQRFADEGLPMGIATSSRKESVQKKRTNHSAMFSKIPTIVPGDHPAVVNGKPAPDIYREAARQLKVPDTSRCLVFEDALSGVRAGKAAGCVVVAVPDPRFSLEEKAVFEKEANVVLESLEDFSWDLLTNALGHCKETSLNNTT